MPDANLIYVYVVAMLRSLCLRKKLFNKAMEAATACVRKVLVAKDADERRAMLEHEESACLPTNDMSKVIDEGAIETVGNMADVSAELYRDLEVHTTLLPALDHTRLRGGRLFLRALVNKPTDDIVILRARQSAVRALETRFLQAPSAVIDAALDDMAATEDDMLWMFRYRDDESLRTLYEAAFFRMWALRALNRSPFALTGANVHQMVISPLIGLLTPIVYFVLPYFVLRIKLGMRLPFRTYVWMLFKSMGGLADVSTGNGGRCIKLASFAFSMVFYFQSIFTSFQVSSTLRKVCRSLAMRVSRVMRFLRAATVMRETLWADELAVSWFPALSDRTRLETVMHSPPASSSPLHFGQGLCAFKTFDHAAATRAMHVAYALDALLSIPRARTAMHGSWASFVSEGGTLLDMRGVRHPSLGHGAVDNDWTLGQHHALLTGPNAGGKSTLMKATLATVLMAQTLTIAPCSVSCHMTPFTYISSHINVPDSAGRESLFEAEMYRAKRNLDKLAGLAPGKRALIVMDEIFSSTNPVEGIAGAYAVARRLASTPGTLAIISTHYTYLCKLERDTHGAFKNFRMPVPTSSSSLSPYKLMQGVSRQYVALELLRRSGFDDNLISDAIAVKRSLLSGGRPRRRRNKSSTQVEQAGEQPSSKPDQQAG